jgi:tape measure domain-containing protein
MAIAKLVVEANANLANLYKELDKGTAAVQRFAAGVKSAGTAMSVGLTLPLVGIGVAVTSAAADMDSLRRGLTAIAGSSKAAEEQLTRLEDVARLPGLGFKEAIQGSIRLQAAGLSVQLTERALRSFGNAIALTGGGKQQLDTITTQLGQLAAKGRVLGSDLRPIIDAAPAVGNALRQAFGTVDPEQIQKLGLTTDQFLTRLTDQLDKLPKVSGGVKNSFENLSDSLFKAKVAIGEQLLPAVVPLIEGLANLLEGARKLNPETIKSALAFGAVLAVVGPLIFAIGQMITAVVSLSAALGVAGLAGTIATGGILLALGLLAAAFARTKLEALDAAAAAVQAAADFRAALSGMDKATLDARFQATTASVGAMMRARNALQAHIGEVTRGGGPVSDATTQQMATVRNLNAMIEAKAAELTAITVEENARAAAAGASRPLVPPGGADKMAGLLDRLTDRLRELAVLQRFNVPSLNLLPDNMQEQVRLVDQLGNELDTLQDGLKAFQRAGRTPPPQLTWGIDVLRAQLRDARVELKALAQDFQMKARIGLLPASPLGGGPARNVGQIVSTVGELPARDANRLASGPIRTVEIQLNALGRALGFVREASLQLGRSLAEGLAQVASGASRFLGDTIRLASALKKEGDLTTAQAAGLGAAFATGMTVLDGAFSVLGPAIDALVSPLRIFGEIVGVALVPILRLLYPILKALAIVLSYVMEAFDRVIGTLLKGIGWFVRAIGKVINFLDPFGNPGNGLVKLGNSLRGSADSFFDAADEIKKKRKELQGLSFDDALNKTTENLNRLSESVINAVQGFKIAKYRFEATAPMNVPTESVRSGSVQASSAFAPRIGEIHIHAAPGEDIVEFTDRLIIEIRRRARFTPSMRTLAAQLG